MIENIVLSRDSRGITALRPYMPPDFCEGAAKLILGHPGTALIVTGFYVPSAGATETDGPPGAVVAAAAGWAGAVVGAGVEASHATTNRPTASNTNKMRFKLIVVYLLLKEQVERDHAAPGFSNPAQPSPPCAA